jgi:fibronectin type III domain protein
VAVDVENAGAIAADEVVQLFLRDDVARVARPDRALVGFARLTLAPGESKTVTFEVDPSVLAYYDEQMQLVIEPGTISAFVRDQSMAFDLAGPERVIAPNDRRPTLVMAT